MNKRFEELKQLAMADTCVDRIAAPRYVLDENKFAELIAYECVRVCEEISMKHYKEAVQYKPDTWSHGHYMGTIGRRCAIKDYFEIG